MKIELTDQELEAVLYFMSSGLRELISQKTNEENTQKGVAFYYHLVKKMSTPLADPRGRKKKEVSEKDSKKSSKVSSKKDK